MPKEIPSFKKVKRKAYNAIIGSYKARLTALQREARSLGISCVILVDGAVRASREKMISGIMQSLDPQSTSAYDDSAPGRKDRHYPVMRRYWLRLPARGETAVFDRGWYREWTGGFPVQIGEDIHSLERQAGESGIVIKLLLHLPKDALRRACGNAGEKKLTGKRYRKLLRAGDKLQAESTAGIPWTVIAAQNKRSAEVFAYEAVIAGLGGAVTRVKAGAPASEPGHWEEGPVAEMPLERMQPGIHPKKEEYRQRVKKARTRLQTLMKKLKSRDLPLVIMAEALDKGIAEQCIRFLARSFDCGRVRIINDRDYSESDSLYPGMRRFYRLLPPGGQTALYERSWYAQTPGRDEACKISGGCSREDIIALERQVSNRGVLVKLWLQAPVSEGQADNEDAVRIAECPACEETLLRTDTAWAPWSIIDAGDRRYARAAALEAVADTIRAKVNQK